MEWERLKKAVYVQYKRPTRLSDPYEDFSANELNELIATPDNRIRCYELLCIFQSHCPAGCYKESVYFLPRAIKYIETRQDDASSVLDNLLGWMDENRHALSRDRLWRLCVSCFCRIIGEALSTFRLVHIDDSYAYGPSIYPIDCDLLDTFLDPIAPNAPILVPILLRKIFQRYFLSIDSYPVAAWLVYLGTNGLHNSNPYLLRCLADSRIRRKALRLILEKCQDDPLNVVFWEPIFPQLVHFDNLSV